MIQSLQDSPTIDLTDPFAAAPPEPQASTIDQVLEYANRGSFRPQKFDRSLNIVRPAENRWIQLMWIVLAAALIWGDLYAVRSYWAPSHPGVDQNGYQFGGKLFSQTFTTGYKPINPYTYVGWMWVQTPDGYVYPKYPLGLPVLDAICIWLAPTLHQGVVWSYLISPVCTVLSAVAIFLMVRMIASSFAAILALILLATNPVALILANNSNSHAPDLCFVTWGMLWLLWWGKYGSWWRGMIAGLLLGYAVTIRYTEGLLMLPMLAMVMMRIRWSSWRSYGRASVPILAWMIPVGALVAFNWFAMHSVTGYDTTNESTGFTLKNFEDKWDFMAGELHSIGLFFLAPIGVAGIALMFKWNWRVALIFTLWFLPGLLLYTAYYWGLNTQGVSYLRFFLTLLPSVIVCAAWMLDHAAAGIGPAGHVVGNRRGTIVAPIAGGIIVACAAGMNLYSIYGSMERDFTIQTNLATVADHITSKATPAFETDPARQPILFGDSRQLVNYIQFAGNYECYSADVFTTRYGQRIRSRSDPDAPNPLQEARIEATTKLYKDKSDIDLLNEATKIINTAISNQRHVYVALPQALMPAFRGRFITHDLTAKWLDTWREPVEMSEPAKKAFMGGGGFFNGHTSPQNWELLEIIKKPPAPPQPVVHVELKRKSDRATTKPKAYFEIK